VYGPLRTTPSPDAVQVPGTRRRGVVVFLRSSSFFGVLHDSVQRGEAPDRPSRSPMRTTDSDTVGLRVFAVQKAGSRSGLWRDRPPARWQGQGQGSMVSPGSGQVAAATRAAFDSTIARAGRAARGFAPRAGRDQRELVRPRNTAALEPRTLRNHERRTRVESRVYISDQEVRFITPRPKSQWRKNVN
jgi:hypothetical protein